MRSRRSCGGLFAAVFRAMIQSLRSQQIMETSVTRESWVIAPLFSSPEGCVIVAHQLHDCQGEKPDPALQFEFYSGFSGKIPPKPSEKQATGRAEKNTQSKARMGKGGRLPGIKCQAAPRQLTTRLGCTARTTVERILARNTGCRQAFCSGLTGQKLPHCMLTSTR